mmetsp:Transcript_31177/g.47713  ORF Transcript_31177/g.47713 Transcript_31177/m.47713 type:complete len:255 (-) Transcript_31177:439-1203(-)
MDQGSVTGQVLEILVGHHDSADSLSQVDEERRVSDVVLGDLSRIVTNFLKVFFAARSENGKTDDGVAHHDGSVLHKHGVEDAHKESLVQDELDVVDQLRELVMDMLLFPVTSVVEGDFLGVVEEISVLGSVLTLELLLNSGELTEGRRDEADDDTGDEVPSDGHARSLPSDELGQLLGEEDDIEDGLGDVEVEAGESLRPLFGVLSEPLIGVANSHVEVADLVVEHVVQVHVVEVLRDSLSEGQAQQLREVFHA